MKKLFLWLTTALLCVSVIAVFSFAGCTATPAAEEPAAEEPAAEEPAAEEPAAEEPAAEAPTEFKHGKTVWLSMPYTGEYWWTTLVDYLRIPIEADGWNFNFATADGSDTTQAEQIINYSQQADILFVDPNNTEAQNEAIRIAEEENHCPVVVYKDWITGKARVQVSYSDYNASVDMAKECVEWLEEKYGTTEDKTVIAISGTLAGGWKARFDGFLWIKENHPEINLVELMGGGSPEGWADVMDAALAGPAQNVDAILSGSDGAYIIGTLESLEKYGKLYYVDDPNHVWIGSIDGKASTLHWIRNGYIDMLYAQTPDSIAASLWDIAKEYILKDASYQYDPYPMPEIPIPLEVTQPEGTFWGGEDKVMVIDEWDQSETAYGETPAPRVDKDNCNDWRHWGNSIIPIIGPDLDPIPLFDAKGTQPDWVEGLVNEYEEWVAQQ